MNAMNLKRITIVLLISVLSVSSFAQDLQTALNLTKSERFEEAGELYKNLISKDPNNSKTYFYYGENLIQEYYADTLAISKKDVITETSKLFKKGVSVDSTNALNYVGLGMLELINNGDTTKADKYLNKASSFVPEKIKKCTPNDVEVLIKLGLAYTYGKNPRFTKALINVYKAKSITLDKNADVYLALGDIFYYMNDGSKAIENYNKALLIDSKSAISQIKIGYIYLYARNLNESRTYFEGAKRADSTFAIAYKGLAEVYMAAGQSAFAKENYRKFLALSGDNTPAKVMYAISLYKSKEYTEALQVIDEVLTIDPKRNFLNRIAAYSCYDRKVEKGVDKTPDYAKGIQYMETFLNQTTPDKIIAKDYTYYGRLQIKLNKDSLSVENGFDNILKSYDMDTTDTKIQDEYIKTAYYAKKYPRAIEMLQRKIAAGSVTDADYIMLGKAYYQMKDYDKAGEIFAQVSEKDPTSMEANVWQANAASAKDPDDKSGIARQKFEDVIKLGLTDSVKYSKDLFDAYNFFASYYALTKVDLNKAKYYTQKMLQLNPSNKDWMIKGYTFYSIIYIKAKDYLKAKEAYRKILELEPKNQGAINGIRDIDRALQAIEKNKQQ